MVKKKRNDLILIGCALLIGILGYLGVEWYKSETTHQGEAVVYVDGKEVARYALTDEGEYVITGVNGENHLVIEGGKAYIEAAECPDKICIYSGKISKNGETLVCLPNKVVVEIVNGTESDVDISTN